MEIIALQGIAKSGKTTTLTMLHDLMVSNGYVETYISKGKKDFCCVLQKNDRKIGLTTRGDSIADLNQDYKNVLTNEPNIDTFICAIHTYGGTVNFVNQNPNNAYRIFGKITVETNKSISPQLEYKANKLQADFLYSEI